MITSIENRECSRTPVCARIELRLGNGVVVEGRAVDVSLRGLMFVTESRLPVGKSVRVAMIADDDTEVPRIEIGGRVARLDDAGVAVAFTHLDPEHVHQLHQLQVVAAAQGDPDPCVSAYPAGVVQRY